MNQAPAQIEITVKVFGGLREAFRGGNWVQPLSAPACLRALVDQLRAEFPDLTQKLLDGIQAGYLNILVNGRNIQFLKGMETPLNAGDTVAFLPPVGGG